MKRIYAMLFSLYILLFLLVGCDKANMYTWYSISYMDGKIKQVVVVRDLTVSSGYYKSYFVGYSNKRERISIEINDSIVYTITPLGSGMKIEEDLVVLEKQAR